MFSFILKYTIGSRSVDMSHRRSASQHANPNMLIFNSFRFIKFADTTKPNITDSDSHLLNSDPSLHHPGVNCKTPGLLKTSAGPGAFTDAKRFCWIAVWSCSIEKACLGFSKVTHTRYAISAVDVSWKVSAPVWMAFPQLTQSVRNSNCWSSHPGFRRRRLWWAWWRCVAEPFFMRKFAHVFCILQFPAGRWLVVTPTTPTVCKLISLVRYTSHTNKTTPDPSFKWLKSIFPIQIQCPKKPNACWNYWDEMSFEWSGALGSF